MYILFPISGMPNVSSHLQSIKPCITQIQIARIGVWVFFVFSVHFFLNCHGTGEDTKEKRPEQKISKFSVQTCDKCHGTNREAGSPSERMVTEMQTAPVSDTVFRSDQQSGEELADTLTAISVVANRLAKKLRSAPAQEASDREGGNDHGKDE